MPLTYKVVETDIVTDEKLEEILNKYTHEGWIFQGIQFAMREASRRPSMAFVIFNKEVPSPNL